MNAFIYQAALICTDCAIAEKERLCREGTFSLALGNTGIGDSDLWPEGPYGQGGGEADSPQHCDHCGEFLENPLTPDGDSYVRGLCAPYEAPDCNGDVASWPEIAERAESDGKQSLAQWIRYYF